MSRKDDTATRHMSLHRGETCQRRFRVYRAFVLGVRTDGMTAPALLAPAPSTTPGTKTVTPIEP